MGSLSNEQGYCHPSFDNRCPTCHDGCRDKKLSEQERKEAELRQCCAEIEQGIKDHGVSHIEQTASSRVCR